jgi:hypothetical protein
MGGITKKLTRQRRDYLIRCGESVAVDTFVNLLNPKNQGVNFKWNKFPLMIEFYVRKHLFLYSPPPGPSEEEYECANDAAYAWAKNAIIKAGLLE